MCGFVAIVGPSPIAPAVLDGMRDRLAHRGPDGARSWIAQTPDGFIGFGHRRLSVIDLSEAAAQPMFSADGQLVISYNGEIYNYLELRRELAALGVRFHTECDTEVLLQAYAVWGPDCLPRLNGMFAFVIWDARRAQLFAARDRFGEKPFFFARMPDGGLAMASEMKALFAHPHIEPVVDEEALRLFSIGHQITMGDRTLFTTVLKLPQAHAMLVDGKGRVQKTWRYWTPDYETIRPYREREAVAEFRELLRDSVRLRLRSDRPLGACLSGGLDSSVLVGVTADLGDDRRYHGKTYSVRFDDDPTISEGDYIDLMNWYVRGEPYGICPEPQQLIDECRALHWHQEEPFISASMYLEWCVMRLARSHDDVVLLNGQGADELLAGYSGYFQWLQFDWLRQGRSPRFAWETLMLSFRTLREARHFENSRRRFDPKIAENLELLLAAWRRGADPDEPRHPGLPSSRGGHTFRYNLARGLLYSVLPEQLNSADRNAMAFGVETKFPFLDYRLVDWCIGLPDEALIKSGWQKYILRRAARSTVPRRIQWRVDKVGFAAPLDNWLRSGLKAWAKEKLFTGPATQLSFYNRAALEEAWRLHQDGHGEQTWLLWRWISINEWMSLLTEGVWKSGLSGPAPRLSYAALA